jgi:transposase
MVFRHYIRLLYIWTTVYHQSNRNSYTWILSTPAHTVFKLSPYRGRKVVKELIGNYQEQTYVTDRYVAYNYLPDKNRQFYWAHLKREFQKISEREGYAGKIGKKLLKANHKFFKVEYNANASSFWKKQKKSVKYFRKMMMKF